jgi:2-aminoethylphosphonate dioxygenase
MTTSFGVWQRTVANRHAYSDDGFLLLPGFFSRPLIDAALADAETLWGRRDLIDARNLRCRFMPHFETGEPLFEVLDPVIDLSPGCARLAADPRLLAVLASLYGEEACLFKDKLIFKPPGARGYGLHQDWIAWPNFPRSFLTVLVALDPADAASGCTQLFAGAHKQDSLTPPDGSYHELSPEMVASARQVDLDLRAGDVAVFGCFVPHRSDPNRTARFRRQLFLSYNARSDGGEQKAAHYQEFHRRLRQRRPQGGDDVYFR